MNGESPVDIAKRFDDKIMEDMLTRLDTTLPNQWTVNDTCYWISTEGFAKYYSEFKSADINGTQLLELNINKLEQLGVSSADAQKILEGIVPLKNRKQYEDESIISYLQRLAHTLLRRVYGSDHEL